MLPRFLKPSYKRYKEDTDRFAYGLVNIGLKYGIQLQPQGQSKTTASGKPDKPLYLATTSQLLELARALAAASISVPASLLTLGRRAIALRKKVTSHFFGIFSSGASNKTHAHFIVVLEEICETLEQIPAETPSPSRNGDADAQAWVNSFAALTVEEPDDTLESPPCAYHDAINVQLDEEEKLPGDKDSASLSNAFFRLYCLFHDLQEWRAFIAQTWIDYRELKIDLMTASIVTDNALQLAKDFVRDALDSWPRQLTVDGTSVQEVLFTSACVSLGVDDVITPGLTYNVEMADIADWLLIPTLTLLRSFACVIQNDSLPVYKQGYLGTYDPKADRSAMSVVQKFNEDNLILMEVLPEFCCLNMFSQSLPVSDEITSGFVTFARDKNPSLWLCFAAQILLDTHHILRSGQLSAFDDLRVCGKRISGTIEDFWKLSKTHPKPVFWPKQGDVEIRGIHGCIQTFIEKDAVLRLRHTAAKRMGHPKLRYQDHLLFTRNPVLCGLLMTHLNFRMQVIGQCLVNQWYDVQQMAFLYNLVRQDGGTKLNWPDIELFIKIHGEKLIFVGDRPKNASQSLNRLELATGISSATRFAPGSRHEDGDFHKSDSTKPRILEPTTKVANLFRDRYMGDGKNKAILGSDVAALLSELSDEAKARTTRRKKGKKTQTKDLASKPEDLLQRHWTKKRDIRPLQLLALIKVKLSEEEPIILFNYFGMHKRCMEMFRLIKEREHLKFVQYFTAGYMPDESMIQSLVILIHHVARGSAEASRMASIGLSGQQVGSRMVKSCGDVMKAYLQENGDASWKELRTFCKNKRHLDILRGDVDQRKEAEKEFRYWFSVEDVIGPAAMASIMTGIPVAS